MVKKYSLPGKAWAAAKSKKLALVLIFLLTVNVITGILFPLFIGDPSDEVPVQVQAVYGTAWFQVLVVLMLVNLTACTIDGVMRRLRLGVRDIGQWGSSLFHLGLIIILTGALATGNLQMAGTMRLVLGEPKKEIHGSYDYLTEGSLFDERGHRGFSVTLAEQELVTDQYGYISEVRSKINISEEDNTEKEQDLVFGQYLWHRGMYMFCYLDGYAVKLSVQPKGGQRSREYLIPLETKDWDNGVRLYFLKGYRVREVPYTFTFNFYPDIGEPGSSKTAANRSFKLGSPGLQVSLMDNEKAAGVQMFRLGETKEINGIRLTFDQVKPWTMLRVVRDPGGRITFTGLAVAVLGLSAAFLFEKGR